MPNELQELRMKIEELKRELFVHDHDGNHYRPIYVDKLFGQIPARVNVLSATIPTTDSNTDIYIMAVAMI